MIDTALAAPAATGGGRPDQSTTNTPETTMTTPPADHITLTRDRLAALLAHHADVIAAHWRAVAPWNRAAAQRLDEHAHALTADEETPAVRELLDSILTFDTEQQPPATPTLPASTAPFAAGLPLVQGHCPSCGTAGLFLGDGGYVTCSLAACPEPDAVSTTLGTTAPPPSAPADADPELTAQEARELADGLGLKLYRAQDALAFVEECCVIADRERRTVTTTDVREWLKGARCGRQLTADVVLADLPAAPAETDEERADREETEHDHAAGIHTHCGLTCEVDLPTEQLRNFVIAKGYPGTAGALDELLRRARDERPLSPYYEHPACGFHWHGRDGMDIPIRDGQPVCPRCELHTVRAAVLREVADWYEEMLANATPEQDPRYWTAVRDVALGLRRLADEAQQTDDSEDRCGLCGHFRGAHEGDRCTVCADEDDAHAYEPTAEVLRITAQAQQPGPCAQHPTAPTFDGQCGGCTQYPADMVKAQRVEAEHTPEQP